MRISSIELTGFGRLRQIQIDFGPGLNVIHGPNEVGKSTLFEAIAALLFGFADSSTQTTQQLNKNKAPFIPWGGGDFAGAIVVSLTNEDRYRIARDFGADTGKVYKMPGASDCTAEYAEGRRGFLSFAEKHLGFARPVFRASAVIDQAELPLSAGNVGAIKDRLDRLAGSGGTEASAQEALRRLDRWLFDRVNPGGRLARTSPYFKAAEEVGRLIAERDASYAVFLSLETAAVEERQLTYQIDGLEQTLQQLNTQIRWAELVALNERIASLTAIDRDLEQNRTDLDSYRDVADDSASAHDAAASALTQVDQRGVEVKVARAVVDDERDAMREITRALADIDAGLTALPLVADEDVVGAETAVRAWDAASTAAKNAVADVVAREAQLIALQSRASPAIAAVPQATTADTLGAAIREVGTCAGRLAEAKVEVARNPLADVDDAEFTRIHTSAEELSDERLEQYAGWESRLASAPPSNAPSTSRLTLPLAIVGAFMGLILGWFGGGSIGAVLGAIVLGAGGYALGRLLAPASLPKPDDRLAKIQFLLNQELERFGATSVAELRRRQTRYLELRAVVPPARERQRAQTDWLVRHQVALDSLFLVGGTRDVDAARAAEAALRECERAINLSTTQLGDAEVVRDAALRNLGIRRDAAVRGLAVVGVTATEPEVAFASLRALRETRLQRQELLSAKAEHRHQADAIAGHAGALADAERKLVQARAIATECLARVGIASLDEESSDRLRIRREAFRAYSDALVRQSELRNSRRLVIGSDDPVEWIRRRDVLLSQVATTDECDSRGVEELGRLIEEARRLRDTAFHTRSQVRANRDSTIQGVRPPAEIEEDLSVATRERDRLERLKNALEGANSLLAEVAVNFRRGFAPRLENGVRETLTTVTGGRYQDVAIDPQDLEIKLKLAGQVDLVPFHRVSHGTRDAVALLLRTSIVNLLSSSNEPVPVFLDDPLVHIDRQRATCLLETLSHLAEQRQLFYFTQDERVIEWAENHSACSVHPLDVITARSTP